MIVDSKRTDPLSTSLRIDGITGDMTAKIHDNIVCRQKSRFPDHRESAFLSILFITIYVFVKGDVI